MAKTKLYTFYTSLCGNPSRQDPIKAHVEISVSGRYMDAVFELVVHEESAICTVCLPHKFYQKLTTPARLLEFV